jgi:hypothetical protein
MHPIGLRPFGWTFHYRKSRKGEGVLKSQRRSRYARPGMVEFYVPRIVGAPRRLTVRRAAVADSLA